jgi:photosystem II stability/assembly factor-like uncharacterized protein
MWRTTFFLAALASFAFAGAPRFDRWNIVGPGGGGGQFIPTVSPHDSNVVLAACDMTGSFISHDGGQSWRMFNLGNRTDLFVFDPSNPDTIYAKTGALPAVMAKDRPASVTGLFRSVDRGETWRLVRADSENGELAALAVDPADSEVLFAVIRSAGADSLHLSTDAGQTWKRSAALAGGGQAIYVNPQSPARDRTIYVMGNQSVAIREGGVWAEGETLPGQRGLFSAGFPERGKHPVIYGVDGASAFVSEDGGRTWRRSEIAGLTSPRLQAVATSLGHPDVAYVSYSNSEDMHGVAKTTDRGKTWTLVWKESSTPAANVRDAWLGERFGPRWGGSPGQLGVAPSDPDICYGTDSGRTMRTTDGGATWAGIYSKRSLDGKAWASTGLDVTTAYGVHFDPFDPRHMFISYTDIGLFASEDAGKTWFSATTGVPRRWTNTTYWIAFDPEVRGRAWGAMAGAHDLPRPKMWLNRTALEYPGGVCQSEDGGKTWKPSNQGMPLTAVTHILVDPKSPKESRTLYATGFATGVYKSTDGGQSWSLRNNGLEGKEPFAWRLTLDQQGTLYLVVARRSDDGGIGGPGDGALYRSTDGAESWTKVPLPADVNGPHALTVDARDARRLYLSAWGRRPDRDTLGGGIFLSTDAGASWKQVLAKDQHIYDVTVDLKDSKVLYASGFEASAWRSTDRGVTWARLRGFNFKWGHRVTADPLDRSKVYITTYGGSVWHGPAVGDPRAIEDVIPR